MPSESERKRQQAIGCSGDLHLLQLSDPHLLSDRNGCYRGLNPYRHLRHAFEQARDQLGGRPDLLLISGDLCQDESWGGYGHLRDLLLPLQVPVALLPGNHDHALLLEAALSRHAALAPAELRLGRWTVVLLSTHRPGHVEGWLEARQLAWLAQRLAAAEGPVLVALHHPPMPIGDPGFDAIALQDPEPLLELLAACPWVAGVVCGHVHQHWQGALPGRPELPLLACPSTLCSFPAVQPCPLGRAEDPGGRLLELGADGVLRQRLLRWAAPGPAAGG